MTNYLNIRLLLLIPLVGLFILAMFIFSFGIQEADILWKQVIVSILNTATIWLGCMVIVHYLWEKYPWEHHPIKHLVLEVIMITTYTVVVSGLVYYATVYLWDMPIVGETGASIIITLLITYLITGIHEGVFFYRQWKLHFSKSIRLERDNIAARYEALRTQINPHFLFNSLNSLTTIVEGNKTATAYIRNLSELLRYMLKSHEKELVLLREEMHVLEHYISLQTMRFKDNIAFLIDVPEGSYHYALPPLSVQMLVENALKHNIVTSEKPLTIKIKTIKDSLVVENMLQRKTTETTTGQGLKNIRGRYALFTSRMMKVEEDENVFRVVLPLLQIEL